MSKKIVLGIISIYLFMFFLNHLNPMSFGDDYVYAFIWPGYPMFTPLPETAARVSGFGDILESQWLHYFTGNGRAPAHFFAQFFIWQGNFSFDLANSAVFIILILEIYWISCKGKVSLKELKPGALWGIFISLWAFTPGFNTVFLWICGACNYLWMTVFLLLFLIPYVRKYYNFHKTVGKESYYSNMMFVAGLFAGWSNENSVCWIILVIAAFLYSYRNCRGNETWMYVGLGGLVTGYVLMLFAPGNMAHLYARSDVNWLHLQAVKKNLYILAVVFMFQFVLWYFNLKSLYVLKKEEFKRQIRHYRKDMLLAQIQCVIAFGMSAIMVLLPSFSPRNGFPGTVQLIIAAGILLRVQNEDGVILIPDNARKFMLYAGILFFIITSSVTIQYSCEMKEQMDALITKAEQIHTSFADEILTVKPFKDSGALKDLLSGYHLSYFELSDNVSDWGNVAFARYYGIKGVRMVRELK